MNKADKRHKDMNNGLSALPNCVGYAWGRAYEILGTRPTLSRGNARDWYGYTADGYKRSPKDTNNKCIPKLGAIVCWNGHVAVIEKLIYNENGEVIKIGISWSGYYHVGNECYCVDFRYKEFDCIDGKPTGGSGHAFQGYIYLPIENITNKPQQDSVLESNFTTSTFVSTATKVQMYYRRESGAKFRPVNVFIITKQNKS
jgi:hypothetical protein